MPASLPQELAARLARQFGPGAVKDMERAVSKSRLPTCRVNTLKATDEKVMELFREQNIAFERVKGIPHAFKIKNKTDRELLESSINQNGLIYLQGLTSMLPPIILDPQPGEAILDLCAAPGSKTTQLAALLHERNSLNPIENPTKDLPIVAIEENTVRYQKLLNTISVQGATSVDARHGDSTQLHKELPEAFDKILADVPCSAEGRIDLTDPRSYKYWSEKNIIAHAKLQRRLLRSAVACLKPGGTLVYSTCTLAPEENEDMIGWLIAEFPELKPIDITIPLKGLRKTAHKSLTVLPSEEAEGFFVAKLQKKG